MDRKAVKLDASWMEVIGDEFDQPYMQNLKQFLREEKRQGKKIYPAGDDIFNALNTTPLNKVKVVILGQDPYHGPGQAHGLCFSVMPGVRFPPSLLNIFKEINSELNLPMPNHGCLQSWAEQGVLLLNATLTVEDGKAGSHQGKGWETFTDAVIKQLADRTEGLVFLLWGSYAQKKGSVIDPKKHYVLKSAHPSPLSAHRGFLGNGHFIKTNEYLQKSGKDVIDWSLPPL
ncbi:Uracil-DNA glycosylase [Thalassocella blandensis]|nr:Uracil-DNA glycosylase [Thalassocella blandensis]